MDLQETIGLSLHELLGLPRTDETWQLLQATGPLLREDGTGGLASSHVTLLVTGEGFVQRLLASDEALGGVALVQLIVDACAWPEEGRSRRPRRIVLSNPDVARDLQLRLLSSGMKAAVGQIDEAEEAYQGMMHALTAPPAQPDFFSVRSLGVIRKFFKTARRFFRAKPWENFPAHQFIAFQLDAGEWHYMNVLGQTGEEFGLAAFRDWLTVCSFTNTAELGARYSREHDESAAFLAAGEFEALQLDELYMASDADMELLDDLQIEPVWRDLYPVVQRYTLDGPAAPRFSPEVYTSLMEVISERAKRAGTRRVSSVTARVDTPAGQLEVRFPARGDEAETRDAYYRTTFRFQATPESGQEGQEAVVLVDAPGEAKLHQVAAAAVRVAEEIDWTFPWVGGVHDADSGNLLWFDRAPAKEPSPTVGQLARLGKLTVDMIHGEEPLEFTALPRPVDARITARLEGTEEEES